MHEGQLREVDYWIAVSKKVGTERLIHGVIIRRVHARRQTLVSQTGDFEVNPSVDWEPEKPVHEVLNRRSSCLL